MQTKKFWKKSPPPYWLDIRAWSLIVPAAAATLGAIAYSVQGIAASQGGVLPASWVDTAVRWGAVLLGVGCEGGTMAACIEIARKQRDGDTTPLNLPFGLQVSEDLLGVGVSYVATAIARIMALITPSPFFVWLLVLSSAADAYFLYKETGDYLSIRDRNMARYEVARWWYEDMHNIKQALFSLSHDEALDTSEEVQKLQDQIEELKATLQDVNSEEQRLVNVVKELEQQVDNSQQHAQQLEQQNKQLKKQLDNNQQQLEQQTEEEQATKKDRILMLLESTAMTDTAIANVVGCSRYYVNKVRNS